MLEKLGYFVKNMNKNSGFSGVGGGVNRNPEVASIVTVDELKYTPKSEFINNANVLNIDDISNMSEAEKTELVLRLQKQNEEVRKDNEQFRQRNFILYMKLRKLGTDGI